MARQWTKEQKLQILEYLKKPSLRETLRKFGISKSTIYRWQTEYDNNPDSLEWERGKQSKGYLRKKWLGIMM